MFTVQQLIDRLDVLGGKLGYDVPVVMSKDGEGNGYSPLSDVESCLYAAETTWYGEVYDDDVDEEDEAPDEAVHAVVLWPVN